MALISFVAPKTSLTRESQIQTLKLSGVQDLD